VSPKGTKQDWATPPHIVEAVAVDSFNGRPFDLDVAAYASNAKAPAYYDLAGNGMASLWAAPQVWCNPPSENQGEWLARAVWHAREYGISVALLVLASTSALYWRPCAWEAGTVDFYLYHAATDTYYIGDLKTGSVNFGALEWAIQLYIYATADCGYVQGDADDGSDDQRIDLPSRHQASHRNPVLTKTFHHHWVTGRPVREQNLLAQS
jgi:hypothetical protein